MNPHLQRAGLLFEQSRYDLAVAELHEALADDPQSAPTHRLLAWCQCALKQKLLARHHAEKAVALAPANPDGHAVLSRVLVGFFDWEIVPIRGSGGSRRIAKAVATPASMTALQAAQEALRLQPDNADYHADLASLKLMLTRWDEALQATTRGLELNPEHIGCLVYRAAAWLETDEFQKAEATIHTLLALNSNSPYGHVSLGDLALHRRQTGNAEQHYLEALRLNPLMVWAERGLQAARSLETGRAFARELMTTTDPVFKDPAKPLRLTGILVTVLLVAGVVLTWVCFQMVSRWLAAH